MSVRVGEYCMLSVRFAAGAAAVAGEEMGTEGDEQGHNGSGLASSVLVCGWDWDWDWDLRTFLAQVPASFQHLSSLLPPRNPPRKRREGGNSRSNAFPRPEPFLAMLIALSSPPHRQHSCTSPSSLSPPPPSSPTFTPLPTATSSATLVLTWRPYNELVVPLGYRPRSRHVRDPFNRPPFPLPHWSSSVRVPFVTPPSPKSPLHAPQAELDVRDRPPMWVVLQHPRRLVVSRGRVHRGRRILDDIVCEGPHVARSHAAVGRASRFLVSRRLTVVLLAALDPQAPSTPHTPSFAPYP
ncbi:hypothetical protein EDB84DRAFT_1563673 [Lactarius hengduanensis]|nr:hypothetical protein EDB84DRAFT_1563673 [Lactarius hengduanensis]